MRTVEEHRAAILRTVTPLPAREVALDDAYGCVLAADVVAVLAVPGFDNSAMDGYAVRIADLAGATEDAPVTLPVLGDIPAGRADLPEVHPGTTVRIMTGAAFPPGADAVVPVEWTDGGVASAAFHRVPTPAQHVRRAGDDIALGVTVLTAPALLTSGRLGLVAAVGHGTVTAHPRPVVAVLSTGSELVVAGEPPGPGQLPDSNSHAIAAAVREAGCEPRRIRSVGDDPADLAFALATAAADADAVITTGGVSVGAYDVVKQVLRERGTVEFDKVAMQPGMPQGFGTVEGTPIFTLPGNPVSALVSFAVFVRPALLAMRGLPAADLPTVPVRTGEALTSPPGRRSYLRVTLRPAADGPAVATLAGGQGSHQVSALATTDALLIVPEETTAVPAGTVLTAALLDPAAGR